MLVAWSSAHCNHLMGFSWPSTRSPKWHLHWGVFLWYKKYHDKTDALFCGAQKCHEHYHIHRINVWYIDLHLWVKYTIHWSYGIHLQYIDPMEMCSHVCVTHTLWQGTEVSPKWWRHRPVQSGVNWWCHHPHTGRHSECRFPEVLWPRITKNSRITWKHVLPIPSTYGLLYWLTRG